MPSPRGSFPTQGTNLGLLHCRPILYRLKHQGSPSILLYPNNQGVALLQGKVPQQHFNYLSAHGQGREDNELKSISLFKPSHQKVLPSTSIPKPSPDPSIRAADPPCSWNAGDCLQCRRARFNSKVVKIPWRRKSRSTPVFLPGESHGQKSLTGYSRWGHKSHTWLSD